MHGRRVQLTADSTHPEQSTALLSAVLTGLPYAAATVSCRPSALRWTAGRCWTSCSS